MKKFKDFPIRKYFPFRSGVTRLDGVGLASSQSAKQEDLESDMTSTDTTPSSPYSPAQKLSAARSAAAKRKQVKNACINCQRACKKCDDTRPCGRCVKYGLQDRCIDSGRRERKRGVKRGPYRMQREDGSEYGDFNGIDGTGSASNSSKVSGQPWVASTELYGRPIRAARMGVSYRETLKDTAATASESEPSTPTDKSRRRSSEKNPVQEQHSALFRMVLNVMHGDLSVPIEQPKITELAAVCSEMIEIEQGTMNKLGQVVSEGVVDVDLHSMFRKAHNTTPVSSVFPRSVLTPPSSPSQVGKYNHVSSFAHDSTISGIAAPRPLAPIRGPFSTNFGRHY